jgi:NAD(P)-dependent dehydrogenase (short-subunit alcohol dehydrogenase family)
MIEELDGMVAVVTGASRGAGRGIALVLGERKATVYITGRSVMGAPSAAGRQGTIEDTASAVTRRGGKGVAVRCDHTVDRDVAALVERIEHEQGRLDLLVNNAWGGYQSPADQPDVPFFDLPFWEQPMWRGGDVHRRRARPLPDRLPRSAAASALPVALAADHQHNRLGLRCVPRQRALRRREGGNQPHGIRHGTTSTTPRHHRAHHTPGHLGVNETTEYLGRSPR